MTTGDSLPDPLSDLDRQRLAAIVESSDDAIVSKDLDGTIRSWNRAAERIFGYTAEEMIGNSIFRVIPPELHSEEHDLLARIRAGEHVAHYETSRVRKDGQRILVSLTLSPIANAAGRLVGASAIKRDVTAHRALELRLQQSQRMEAMGRLAGGVAHDFNNLLTVIGGTASLLLRRFEEATAERNDIEQIAAAADRATALTRQLLAFSRRQLAEIEVLHPDQILRALDPMLRRLVGEHIELRTVLGANIGPVRANRGQLEQMVMNLVVNARDAMPDGGTLTIEASNADVDAESLPEEVTLESGRYVVIAVSDTGEGMDPVTRAAAFEPFFTTKEVGRGTGLGLALVYGIVQQVGGAVAVSSEPGRGSVFKIFLPQASGAPVAPAAHAPAHVSARTAVRATVLLVEDEPSVRSFTRRVLEEEGYTVLDAGDGESALMAAAAHRGPIDLLLTDIVMPGINGRILADRMRAAHPDIAVVYMSGYTDDMVLRTGVLTHGSGFLQKPFSTQALIDRLRLALHRSAPSSTPA